MSHPSLVQGMEVHDVPHTLSVKLSLLTTPTEMNSGFFIISEAIFSMRGGMVAENIRFCLNRGRYSLMVRTCNTVNNYVEWLVCRSTEEKLPAIQILSAEESQPRQQQILGYERDQCLQLWERKRRTDNKTIILNCESIFIATENMIPRSLKMVWG